MEFEQITTELSDHVLTITMNRPDRLNAWTRTMFGELMQAFEQADADDEVRAVIVTGAGRAFCAGADLERGGETFAKREHEDPDSIPRDQGGRLTLRIFELTKPVIAAINGPAVGIGATMTLPMDVRLAADDARIGFVFARRGIVPEACSSWFLPRVVGISQAMEWVATGRVFGAEEALRGGLVRSLHPQAELLDAAAALAREIADNAAPVSVALARRMMWTMLGAEHPMLAHRADSRGMFYRGRSADAAEGIAAFLEKRPASSRTRSATGCRTSSPGGRRPNSAETPLPFAAMRVLVLDNYDSFTYNLVQYLGELGAEVEVVRNDHATVDDLLVRGYDRVIVSPGPCTPNEAGISLEAVKRFPEAEHPHARRLPRPPGARAGMGRQGDPARARTRQDDGDRARRPDDLPGPAPAARGRALPLAGGRSGAARLLGVAAPTAARW